MGRCIGHISPPDARDRAADLELICGVAEAMPEIWTQMLMSPFKKLRGVKDGKLWRDPGELRGA
jgi:hypothetical protein